MGIIEDWGLTPDELNFVLSERPSVRGILIGFCSGIQASTRDFL